MPQLFIIKICLTIKANSICCTGQDTWNLRHKFNSESLALRILGLRVAISKFRGPISRFLGVRVPESQDPSFQSLGSQVLRVLGSQISGLRVLGPGSQVSILDYAYFEAQC